jgi:hypothetical protein
MTVILDFIEAKKLMQPFFDQNQFFQLILKKKEFSILIGLKSKYTETFSPSLISRSFIFVKLNFCLKYSAV